jgi:multisubunit Na+/H+ antiporter MnhG subunit
MSALVVIGAVVVLVAALTVARFALKQNGHRRVKHTR